ncbi:tetratricopeptide repeat protein [Aliarcobacter cibarius]|uniref:tetratricopeptide repeat protein n=1 Tax=Aliarcobacter cibarius TaxID=255507 RepID=UPI0010FF0342|nr:tetratricopeptide repeat protein [Aliarcobacter cibarius]TLT03766.1 tetratricopeptide repeat protein [Aliarcobacter cibarius]
MKFVYKIVLSFFLLINILYANNDLIESQPEILFQFEKLKKSQENLALQVDFNKAVLHLNRKEYEEAIRLFLKTAKILEVPSYLNMGIAYFKLNQVDKAILYLNKIHENESIAKNQSYSYLSACYYLYSISKDNKYLDTIVRVARKDKNLSSNSKRMLADTYVILKDYEAALEVLDTIDFNVDLKKALLNIKLKNYEKASLLLNQAKEKTQNPNTIDKILWISAFVDLKLNRLDKLKETLDLINNRKLTFKANIELPLEMYFNKNKFTSAEYLNSVLSFDSNRKVDFLFYFAPFVFSDSQEIIYDSIKGFIYNDKDNILNLEGMVEYNAKFLALVKGDPILRVVKLKEMLKDDTKSYIYYNLALSYAQINDYNNAYKYFEKAYKLNPGNKLYLALYLVSANKINATIKDREYIENSMKSDSGMYNYFGKEIYKQFVNSEFVFTNKAENFENTIFFQALDFLKAMDEKKNLLSHPLLNEYIKDPFTLLIRLVQRKPKENDFDYYARLQDTIPLTLNNYFLEGPLVVTKYYVDILKSLGIFNKADMKIVGGKSPSYLRTKAIRDLHYNLPNETIKTLEYLQNEYNLEDKYTMYLIVAALLEAGRYNDASIQITLIKSLLNDQDADFLTAIQLIQDLKIFSAKQFLNKPYLDSLIDFRLVGFDEYLESL